MLCHIAKGATKCKRAEKGITQIARKTGTAGVIAGWRKPTSVNARGARNNCIASADAKVQQDAGERHPR